MKIALIGDSHTQITFDLLIPLLESMGHTVVGRISKPGWATYSFNAEPSLFNEVVKDDPDVVIASIGGNNSRLDDTKYRESVMEFLNHLGYPRRKIIWLGPMYSIREDVNKRHLWTANWLAKNLPYNVTFIDMYPFSMSGHGEDGVHFKRSAYNQIVASVEGKIDSAVELYKVSRIGKIALPIAILIGIGVYIRNRR